jgi:hypothetical protein
LQTDTEEELAELKARAHAADMTLLDEGETSCCYARSDKYWVTDPQGIAWEQFHTLASIPTFSEAKSAAQPAACCATVPRGKAIGIPVKRPPAPPAAEEAHVCTEAARRMPGHALLLAVVIGSGIMGGRLAGGNVAIALLANTLATVGGLYVLDRGSFRPISERIQSRSVPVMTVRGELPRHLLVPYVVSQLFGAALGAWLAHAMFDLGLFQLASKVRTGNGQWIAEGVATFGLVLVVLRAGAAAVPRMVAALHRRRLLVHRLDLVRQSRRRIRRMLSDTFAASRLPAFLPSSSPNVPARRWPSPRRASLANVRSPCPIVQAAPSRPWLKSPSTTTPPAEPRATRWR